MSGSAGLASATLEAPVHPGPAQDDDQRDYGLPGRDDGGLTGQEDRDGAPAALAAGTRPYRPRPEASPGEPRPGGRRAQARGRPRRRRGRRHVLLWAGAGLLVVAGGAVAAVLLLRSGPAGPPHTLTTPARLGAYLRRPQLARQMDVAQLEKNIVAHSSGQASHLVSAVYQDGSAVPGGPAPQVLLFIGGKLTGATADASVKSFAQHFQNAKPTSPGPLGGEAACVPGQPGTGGAAVCAWFDDDTFGELVSPHMTASALASELRAIRPSIEKMAR